MQARPQTQLPDREGFNRWLKAKYHELGRTVGKLSGLYMTHRTLP